MSRALILVLLLATPTLAGCFSDPETASLPEGVAASAEEAGAVSGPAPVAAKSAYQVQTGEAGAEKTTVYPLAIRSNAPRAPYTEEFTGVFEPYQCLPTGGGLPLGGLGLARGGARFDVADAFVVNDVFSYDVSLRFTNTDQSWAELHLWHQFDGVGNYWNEPVSDARGEVVMNFTGQGFIVNDEFFAVVGVDCWFGMMTSPIAFTITMTISYADGGVPSGVPVAVEVPEGATRLLVTGLALDGDRGVTSHFRVFAPDDSLVCECALLSTDEASVVEIEESGEFVVLVDHSENGFVALALDAPPMSDLRPLATSNELIPLVANDGGRVDETLLVDFPSTPLGVFAWVFAPGDWRAGDPPNLGAGHNFKISVTNGRGDVLRMALAGYFTFHAAVPGMFATNDWYAVPIDGEWEFFVDHHAYDLGGHTVVVKADELRGRVVLFATFYDRASAA